MLVGLFGGILYVQILNDMDGNGAPYPPNPWGFHLLGGGDGRKTSPWGYLPN